MKVYTKIFLLLLSVMITTKVSWAQTTTNPNVGSEKFVSVANKKTDLSTSFNSKGVNETGDDCSDPIIANVEIGTPYSDLDQYTCGRGNNYENSSYYEAGEESVYQVNVLENMDFHIAVDPKGTKRVSFQIYSDCPDVGSLIKRKTSWSGTPMEHNLPLVAGTYYITKKL